MYVGASPAVLVRSECSLSSECMETEQPLSEVVLQSELVVNCQLDLLGVVLENLQESRLRLVLHQQFQWDLVEVVLEHLQESQLELVLRRQFQWDLVLELTKVFIDHCLLQRNFCFDHHCYHKRCGLCCWHVDFQPWFQQGTLTSIFCHFSLQITGFYNYIF